MGSGEVRPHAVKAESLRALAHPLRLNLLDALAASGTPLTATEAAEIVGESPANCSWHFRQLAKHGYVREASTGPGRRRPWELSSEGFEWRETGEDRRTNTAARELSRMILGRELDKYFAYVSRSGPDDEWAGSVFSNAAQLWLTTDELHQVGQAVNDLLTPYARRARSGRRPQGSALVRVVAWGAPDADPFSPGRR